MKNDRPATVLSIVVVAFFHASGIACLTHKQVTKEQIQQDVIDMLSEEDVYVDVCFRKKAQHETCIQGISIDFARQMERQLQPLEEFTVR